MKTYAGKTVEEVLIDKTAKIGEKLSIRRFVRFETTEGLVEKYIHGDGKIGVLVDMPAGNETLAKDICMQIGGTDEGSCKCMSFGKKL